MPKKTLRENERDTLITLVRGGADLSAAAYHIGWDPGDLVLHLDKPSQASFKATLDRAAAQKNLADQAVIANADDGNWQAARARLEMREASARELHVHRLRALTTD